MADNDNAITIITGEQLAKHPFYKERSELDTITGHEWIALISMSITCAMGFRLGAIALQLLDYPTWMVIFFIVILVSIVGLTYRLKFKMPRMLSAVAFSSALGFIVGFIL